MGPKAKAFGHSPTISLGLCPKQPKQDPWTLFLDQLLDIGRFKSIFFINVVSSFFVIKKSISRVHRTKLFLLHKMYIENRKTLSERQIKIWFLNWTLNGKFLFFTQMITKTLWIPFKILLAWISWSLTCGCNSATVAFDRNFGLKYILSLLNYTSSMSSCKITIYPVLFQGWILA